MSAPPVCLVPDWDPNPLLPPLPPPPFGHPHCHRSVAPSPAPPRLPPSGGALWRPDLRVSRLTTHALSPAISPPPFPLLYLNALPYLVFICSLICIFLFSRSTLRPAPRLPSPSSVSLCDIFPHLVSFVPRCSFPPIFRRNIRRPQISVQYLVSYWFPSLSGFFPGPPAPPGPSVVHSSYSSVARHSRRYKTNPSPPQPHCAIRFPTFNLTVFPNSLGLGHVSRHPLPPVSAIASQRSA